MFQIHVTRRTSIEAENIFLPDGVFLHYLMTAGWTDVELMREFNHFNQKHYGKGIVPPTSCEIIDCPLYFFYVILLVALLGSMVALGIIVPKICSTQTSHIICKDQQLHRPDNVSACHVSRNPNRVWRVWIIYAYGQHSQQSLDQPGMVVNRAFVI